MPAGEAIALVDTGAAKGVVEGDIITWKGIPFAAPPIGDLRWKPPQQAECWTGELAATDYGNVCPQFDANGKAIGDEDCLTLNVWAPKTATTASKLPVMVFIHGGGHQQGSSSETIPGGSHLYDSTKLAEKGVVAVTINYRLGPFGFLAHKDLAAEDPNKSTGNYGTMDQVAALAWVKRNIAAFGGDPSKVTIFGESAGGVSVCAMMTTPLSEGLFQGAIIESAGCTAKALDKAEANGDDVATKLNCTSGDVPACLRKQTTADVLATMPAKVDIAKIGGGPYDAAIDGYVFSDNPANIVGAGKHHHVPVMLGTNSDETAKTIPANLSAADFDSYLTDYLTSIGVAAKKPEVVAEYAVQPMGTYPSYAKALVAITSDVKFVCPTRRTARALIAHQTEPVYRYMFGHTADKAGPASKALGAPHGFELLFVFGVMDVAVGGMKYVPGPNDLAISEGMQSYWTSFAQTGAPSAAGLATWAAYDATDPYMEMVDAFSAKSGLRDAECDFWTSLAGG